MVKTYSYSRDKQIFLSAHFQVGEFKSFNGSTGKLTSDEIKIDEALPVMLEKVFEKLNCSKIIITSGYRTPDFEKMLSGKVTGQHVLGKAADVICYDKDGKKISPKEVCLAAQDLGVKGIGYMSGGNHLDVRASKSWFDETKSNKVVSDWYSYFGESKPSAKTGTTTLKAGRWNVRTLPSLGSKVARVVKGVQSVTYVDIVPELHPTIYGNRKFYKLRDGTYISVNACK